MTWKIHNSDGKKYTNREIQDALILAEGVIVKAAKILECTTVTIYRYIDDNKKLGKLMEILREAKHHVVISKLHDAIDDNELTAIIYYLKTQCKHLGFSEKFEVEGFLNHNVNVTYKTEIIDGQPRTTKTKS